MSAVEALSAARAAGISVEIDGDDLVLEAPVAPPPIVLDLLSRHKTHVVTLLRRQARMTVVASSRPLCASEIAERSSLIEETDHCDSNTADHRAVAEACYGSWQALGVAAALNALPQPTDLNGRRLIAETQHFLGSNWFRQALKCGWTLEGLFGVDGLAPLERLEQWGLIVGLALAPKPGDVIEHLDAEHAVIRYRVGSLPKEARRIERRFVPADYSVPWWKCSALVSYAEWLTQLSEPC
jgi:hypothetical protein